MSQAVVEDMFGDATLVAQPAQNSGAVVITQFLENKIKPTLGNAHHCPEVDMPFLLDLLQVVVALHARPVPDPPAAWELGAGATDASVILFVYGFKQPIDVLDLQRMQAHSPRVLGVTIRPEVKKAGKSGIIYTGPLAIEFSTSKGEQQSRADPSGRTDFCNRREFGPMPRPEESTRGAPPQGRDRERDRSADDQARAPQHRRSTSFFGRAWDIIIGD
jgi:hypothetical protein